MIIYKDRARRELDRLPAADAEGIAERLAALAAGAVSDVKKLSGRESYRLRVGRYRVLFNRRGGDIVVERIADRKDAYRR
jgi:mRNA interferase RelE/StbE